MINFVTTKVEKKIRQPSNFACKMKKNFFIFIPCALKSNGRAISENFTRKEKKKFLVFFLITLYLPAQEIFFILKFNFECIEFFLCSIVLPCSGKISIFALFDRITDYYKNQRSFTLIDVCRLILKDARVYNVILKEKCK